MSTVEVRGFRFETKPATESAALGEEVAAAFLALNQPGIPNTLRKELLKTISRNALEDSGPDILAKSDAEIEAMPAPEQVQADQAAQQFQNSFTKMNDRLAARQEIESATGG